MKAYCKVTAPRGFHDWICQLIKECDKIESYRKQITDKVSKRFLFWRWETEVIRLEYYDCRSIAQYYAPTNFSGDDNDALHKIEYALTWGDDVMLDDELKFHWDRLVNEFNFETQESSD